MTENVEIPLWLFVLILLFAAVTALSHFLLPSVRWFFRRRLEKAVARLNTRLTRPIEPFKLARRYDMIQRLIYDPEVTQAIVDHAKANGIPENVAFQQARRYAREIVPSFSAFAYFGFGIRIARMLSNMLYQVREANNSKQVLSALPSDATVIFIMNHRSNMDYLLVTYLAAGASALSYAVGEWARVWPLTGLIKSMGAYFIRRKSRGALYRTVLARYVSMATRGGVTQAIFPEGGLSLDGKLAPPKLGLLSYVLETYDPKGRDIIFVPVAINYDRVLEDRVLVAAGQRGDRRFGGKVTVVFKFIVRKIWLRLTGRFLGFGEASVMFGQPMSLHNRPQEVVPQQFAQELMREIEQVMPVMGVPLMCHVFLKADKPLTVDAMRRHALEQIAQYQGGAPLPDSEDLRAQLVTICKHMEQRKFITQEGEAYVITDEQRPVMQFYANSIAHSFAMETPENGSRGGPDTE